MMALIGIDVSKAKLDIGWLRDPAQGKIKTKAFKNQLSVFPQVADWLVSQTGAAPEDVLITLEPTGTCCRFMCRRRIRWAVIVAG